MSPPDTTDPEGSGAPAPGPSVALRRPHRRRAMAAAYFVCATWAWVAVSLVVWAVLPMALQMTPLVVESGSMRPALDRGDLVLVQPVPGDEAAIPGRVITFDDPGIDGRITTHRVDAVDPDGRIWTRGDANADRDSMPVVGEDVHGMARFVVPLVGLPKLWFAEGEWPRAAGVVVATFLALVVVVVTGPALGPEGPGVSARRRGRGRGRRGAVVVGAGVTLVALVGSTAGDSTTAAFAGSTGATSTYTTGDFSYASVIDRSEPAFWWRLGDDSGTLFTFEEDFETSLPWSDYGSGSLTSSSGAARTGSAGGLKSGPQDLTGGFQPLGFTTETHWVFEGWVRRPTGSPGNTTHRLAVTDAAFDGYGVSIRSNLTIERRDGNNAENLATAPLTVPSGQWFRVRLERIGSSLTATTYAADGTELATTSTTDTTHGGADRLVVSGRQTYAVDDLSLTARVGASTVATDARGQMDGSYVGSPALGAPALIAPDTDPSVGFGGPRRVLLGDHPALNTAARSDRSLELWFHADVASGRQVLYEEGGGTNGMAVYLEGTVLRARAWSRSNGWTNDLDTSTVVTAGTTHHVVVTLDAVNQPNLTLYLDGMPVDTAAKGDTLPWAAHGDGGAIAGIDGSTRFHDGTASGVTTTGLVGRIDEVAVYNAVLDPARVVRHWAAGT